MQAIFFRIILYKNIVDSNMTICHYPRENNNVAAKFIFSKNRRV